MVGWGQGDFDESPMFDDEAPIVTNETPIFDDEAAVVKDSGPEAASKSQGATIDRRLGACEEEEENFDLDESPEEVNESVDEL